MEPNGGNSPAKADAEFRDTAISALISIGGDEARKTTVETKGGDLFAGAIRKETDDALTILGADFQPHLVKKADIKIRKPIETSIMPPGLTLGLRPEAAPRHCRGSRQLPLQWPEEG